MDRRQFIAGLLAATAPLPSLSPPVTMRYTSYGVATQEMIRNELLPGLFDVRANYEMIPRQWDKLFKTRELPDTFDNMFDDTEET